MSHKIAVVLTDNGAIYWGEPIAGLVNCVTLQNIQCKDQLCFPTKEGRLSIPLYRVIEIIEIDDTFQSTQQILTTLITKFGDKRANDVDDPSIAQAWILAQGN